MYAKEFLQKLAQTKDKFRWVFEDGIRGYRDIGGSPMCFCPITAVCLTETDKCLYMDDVGVAADELGMDEDLMEAIVHSADNCHMDNYLAEKLIEAVGLEV